MSAPSPRRLPMVGAAPASAAPLPVRGARALAAALALTVAALFVCVAHAAFAGRGRSRARLRAALDLATTGQLDAPALAGPEDLRHPGWARAEMPLGGQPTLVDPRAAALVVRPPAMQVAP